MLGVNTNNGMYLIQSLWGWSNCLFFWQKKKTWEKIKVHMEPCTSFQLTAGCPTCKTYLWVLAGFSWCWPTLDEPPIKKVSGLENRIFLIHKNKTFDIFGEDVNHWYVYVLTFGAQLYLILNTKKQKIKVPPFAQYNDFLILLINVKIASAVSFLTSGIKITSCFGKNK